MTMKKLLHVQSNPQGHWVGDGFPVRSIFNYNQHAEEMSPFLMMDYGGPTRFEPSENGHRRGVGEHPHRGFETVTIVYDGEVEHRDSSGGGGIIRKGDVQWMTAASGLVHEEFHGPEFSKTGGPFEMIQLWVNLPKKDKMTTPRYQGITNAQIPTVTLPDGAGKVRVIAGDCGGTRGPAETFSPVNLWDVRLNAGGEAEFKVPEGYTTGLFVLKGPMRLATGETVTDAQLALLDREGDTFAVEAADGDAKILILNGQPLGEPVVGYGPFVMTTMGEIKQAFIDFQSGRMGRLSE